MDNPTTLLVAIMYVMIISIGLSNLLMTLSELAGGRAISPDRVHLSWLILLLFAYLNYFWQTTVILDVDNWRFISFVPFLIGPICLLFATNLLIVLPETEDVSPSEHYMKHSNRFFLFMSVFNVWLVGLDFVADNISMQTWLAGVIAIFLFILMASDSYRVHKIGAPAGWVLFLTNVGLNAV
jgi:hypothetical protein